MQRIAIIQNDDHFSLQLEQQLWNDYNVSLYRDGKSFLKHVGYNQPDVVFIDEQLPDCKSLDLITRIRRISRELPVVLHVSTQEIWQRATDMRDDTFELVFKGSGSIRHTRDKVYTLMLKQRLRSMRKQKPSLMKQLWNARLRWFDRTKA